MTTLSKKDWLNHGLQRLAEGSMDALKIDMLCKDLGVTKGSFYHHFENHQSYLEAVLQYWEEEYTASFIEFSEAGGTVEEKLVRLNDRVMQSFGEHEVYIRVWALSDPVARVYQERVDSRRIQYLTDLYGSWLNDAPQAQTLAHLIYATLIGSTSIIPPLTLEQFARVMSLMPQLIQSLLREDKT